MATGPALPLSVVSVVDDVIQKHGRLSDIDLASRKAEEAASRRNEAAAWLRKTVGGKDIPAEPSEEDFRIALRNGIILCNALNRIQPGAVPKVVEAPFDLDSDGAALSAYQYFENVRNFLVTMEEMGLPTFEVSDLEKGGQSLRIVNCVLALKSYDEWILGGKIGLWKYGGNPKPPTTMKPIMRKNSEPFMRSTSRGLLLSDKDTWPTDASLTSDTVQGNSLSIPSLNSWVREALHDKKQEDIPIIVESLIGKVMEEFERRITVLQQQQQQQQQQQETSNLKVASNTSHDEEMKENEDVDVKVKPEECDDIDQESSIRLLKQKKIIEHQNESIQELKMMVDQTKTGMSSLQNKSMEDFLHLSKHVTGLASAASGYQKILEENRKLYNQMQDLKGNIRVYCRVRPLAGGNLNHNGIVSRIEEESISLIIPAKKGKEGKKTFSFNRVFGPSATQGEVFSDTQPLIRSVLDGYNVCIFAYGQTGSGKTHTMSGPNNLTEETVGVNYRALRDLFHLSEQRKDTIHYDISVQMLEIYNEQVKDLLVTDGFNKRLEIRNSSLNGINVPDASLLPVSSTDHVLNLMNLGQKNRTVGATAMNDRSSRSHSCLTVHVQGTELTSGNTLRGCIHLVDLAGSERVDKSEVTGDRLKEAQHINKSLSALGDVIASLAQKQSHVPYRNSKLTQLLQDSLGGQAKTLMFVHVSPEPEALSETLSTLKFAERVSTIELGAAKVNKDSNEVKELKDQIASLKATIVRKDGELEQFRLQSANSSSEPRLRSQLSSPIIPSSGGGGRKLPRNDSMSSSLATWANGTDQDDKESSSGIDDGLTGQSEGESKRSSSSPMLSPTRMEIATTCTNDSDELELETSECSESDTTWQSHVPKIPPIVSNGSVVSRPKKPAHPKQGKNQETRSIIPLLIRSSPKKQSPTASNSRKHPGSTDAKRKSGKAK